MDINLAASLPELPSVVEQKWKQALGGYLKQLEVALIKAVSTRLAPNPSGTATKREVSGNLDPL